MIEKTQNPIEQIKEIQQLRQFLSEKKQEDLAQILQYGNEIKKRGEKLKEEFWSHYNREDFLKLLNYKKKNKDKVEGKYKYLDTMKSLEREKYIEEYLYDDMLYGGEKHLLNIVGTGYWEWKNGNIVIEEGSVLSFNNKDFCPEVLTTMAKNIKLKDGVYLNLKQSGIGPGGAKAISNIKLKDGVYLNLTENGIGPEGAKYISNIKLKNGVVLELASNHIGDKGATTIANNLKLKKGVTLDLRHNEIGPKGAIAIAKNLKLEEGVTLNLYFNFIGDKGVRAIAENLELKEGVTLKLGNIGIGDVGVQTIIHNMELKDGVTLDLRHNVFGNKTRLELKDWEQSYIDKGIQCKVLV